MVESKIYHYRHFPKTKFMIIFGLFVFLLSDSSFQQELNKSYFRINKARINSDLLISKQNQDAALVLKKIPRGMFLNNDSSDEKIIEWDPPAPCTFRYSTRPGSRNLNNYPNTINASGAGQLTLNPYTEGMGTGIYYAILVSESDPSQTSVEFKVIVQADKAAIPQGPKGLINLQKTPEFKWDRVAGVPYYSLFLSEGKITIERNEENEITGLGGLNLTWQVITPDNKIEFGSPDPTGNFVNAYVPPLFPGVHYDWLVLNCYGPSMELISSDVAPLAPENFKVTRPELSSKPALIQPENDAVIANDEVVFNWASVAGVSRYRVFLYENAVSFGNSIKYILWSQVTSDTQIRLKAKSMLIDADYQWRVMAENSNGLSASDRRPFKYNASAGWVEFSANSEEGLLSKVSIEIKDEADALYLLPAITDTLGIVNVALPMGNYTFRASISGFLTTPQAQFSISSAMTKIINLQMERSHSALSGQIVDESGTGIFNAAVELKNGELLETTKSDEAGYFSYSVNSGAWSIRPIKPGFVAPGFQSIPFLQNGEARDLGAITLVTATNTVSGTVVFAADGRSLQGAYVRAQMRDMVFKTTTDDQGKFIFKLGPGTWRITLESQGFFAVPPEKTVELTSNQQKTATFQLFSGGVIYGEINYKNRGVVGAEVHAYHKDTRDLVQTVISNIQGSYSLGIRDTGNYELVVTHENYLGQRADVTIIQGQTIRKEFNLLKAGFAAGTVKHANTFEPLENVEVFVVEDSTNNRTTTNTYGAYMLSFPPDQLYNINAAFPGFEKPGPFPVTSSAGETTNLPILLKPLSSASIIGKVINENSVPIAGANVEIEEVRIKVTTDANGNFEITDLQPGVYTLIVSRECHIDKTITIVLTAGDMPKINIILEELKSVIAGGVRDIHGARIENAKVEAVDLPLALDRFIEFTDSNGSYELCLKGGQFKIEVSHPGFLSKEILLSINDGERKEGVDFTLEDNFATIMGLIKNTSDSPISQAEVILTNSNQVLRDISESNGYYIIDRVYPGISKIKADMDGFFGKTITLNLSGQEVINLDLTLFPEDGFISGTVRNASDNNGLAGVTITATFSENSEIYYVDSTDISGKYSLSNLPVVPNATFTVGAFKNGYVSEQETVSGVSVNKDNLDFYLFQPNAIIAGIVEDIDTGEPLDSVKVVRSGSTNEIYTDKAGRFILTSLRSGVAYDIMVSRSGFFPKTLQNVAAGDTNVVIKMLRKYAFVTGRVTDTDGLILADVEIHATPEQEGEKSITTTDESGEYRLNLIADTYDIRPEKSSYRSTPISVHLQLTEDSTKTGVDFILTPQTLQFINVSGESEISNLTNAACFEAIPKDLDGIDIVNFSELTWTVNVTANAVSVNNAGCLEINPNYFGELTITATDPASGISGNLEVEVFAPIDSTTDTILFDDRGLQMVINKRSIPTGVNLLVSKKPVAPAKKGRALFFTTDSSYVIKPVGVLFNGESDVVFEDGSRTLVVNSPIKLRLPPPPNTEGQRRFIARWDEDDSEWFLLATALKDDNMLEANILETGEYIALSISKPLAIDNLKLLPNPFSPYQEIDGRQGLKIEFDVSSRAAPNPLLSLKIYNLEGNLVRNLHDQTPFPRGHAIVYWDGKTDNGVWARNGRYLVRLILEDPTQREAELKSVVLIK